MEHHLIVDALKNALKVKGLSYKDVADHLRLSEASVKRLFSKYEFSLHRLEQVCQLSEIKISDLIETSSQAKEEDTHLYSLEQEEFFSKNPKYLAFFDLLIRLGSLKKVRKAKPQLSESKINTYLKKIEQLGLIQRNPGDRITFPVSRNVVWRQDGPLRRTFLKWAKNDFINSDFKAKNEFFSFIRLCTDGWYV